VGAYTLLSQIPDNCRTKNYGKEVAAEGASLSGALLAGLGLTSNPAIANPTAFGAFAAGSATGTTFNWGEVGIISLTPAVGDGDYLGAGPVAGTTTGNVGRFYADHFDVVVTPQCAGFIYAGQPGPPVVPGQPFTVTATARNASGGATLNYSAASGFSRSLNLSLTAGASVGNLYVDAVAGGNGAIPAGTFAAAVGQVASNAAGGRISYVFGSFPTAATAIAVHAEDADSASGTALTVGSDGLLSARAGRLYLSNAYGSELLPLTVPGKIQSWTANGWVNNAADSCTVLTIPTNTNGGLTNVLSAKTVVSPAPVVINGDIRQRLTTPGAGNAGLVDITGAVLRGANNWLVLPTPFARACFGLCGPRSPIIYLRESY
jgi:MSHA biogenesis protein MshQ